jgi:hypothetical protein
METLTHSLSVLSDGSLHGTIVTPRDYDLLYVLPEYELVGMSRPEYNGAGLSVWGLPPTVKFLETSAVPLYESDGKTPADTWELLYERFAPQCPTSNWDINQHFKSYLSDGTCYTDHTNGKGWNSLITCGNVLYPTGNLKRTAGELYHEVRQLQAGKYQFMKDQLTKYPLLETWATNSTRENGGKFVGPFPHCGGNDVPALLFCKTATNWVRDARVRRLERTEPIPPLYHV